MCWQKTSGWWRWKRFLKNSNDTVNFNGHGWMRIQVEVVLYAEARGHVAPKLGQVSKIREDRDHPMDVGGFGQWKGRNFPKGKRKNSTGIGKREGHRKRWKG